MSDDRSTHQEPNAESGRARRRRDRAAGQHARAEEPGWGSPLDAAAGPSPGRDSPGRRRRDRRWAGGEGDAGRESGLVSDGLPPGVYDLRDQVSGESPDPGLIPEEMTPSRGLSSREVSSREVSSREVCPGTAGLPEVAGVAWEPHSGGTDMPGPGLPDGGPASGGPRTGGPTSGGLRTGGPAGGGLRTGGPASGGLRVGDTGPIRMGPPPGERLRADRLHGDPVFGDISQTGRLPVPSGPHTLDLGSFPDLKAGYDGTDARSGHPQTRHRPHGGSTGTARRDRVLLPVVLTVLAVIVGFGAGGTWLVLGPLRGSGERQPASAVVVQRQTVLVGLTDGEGLRSAVLVAAGPAAPSAVLVPPSLLVDGGAGKQVTLSSTARSGANGPAGALARLLGVKIAQSWMLTPTGLATLVDNTGGVVVNVDQEIRLGTVLVAAGKNQRLTGDQAGAFVAVALPGEGVEEQLGRFATVIGQVMAGLPAPVRAASQQLAVLGEESTATGSRDELAAQLVAIGQQVGPGGLTSTPLPVVAAGSGATPDAVTVDKSAAARLLRDNLGETTPPRG